MDDGEAYNKYSRISEKANNSRDTRKPYVIGVEEFSEDMTHFDKLTIYYYEDDDTLVEGGEDIITDVDWTIGNDSLDHFGDNSDDPDIVYVRNERISVDYEVIRLPKSYAETVLGYEKDEGKGRKVRRGEVDEE
jgi:hypothetical protein